MRAGLQTRQKSIGTLSTMIARSLGHGRKKKGEFSIFLRENTINCHSNVNNEGKGVNTVIRLSFCILWFWSRRICSKLHFLQGSLNVYTCWFPGLLSLPLYFRASFNICKQIIFKGRCGHQQNPTKIYSINKCKRDNLIQRTHASSSELRWHPEAGPSYGKKTCIGKELFGLIRE